MPGLIDAVIDAVVERVAGGLGRIFRIRVELRLAEKEAEAVQATLDYATILEHQGQQELANELRQRVRASVTTPKAPRLPAPGAPLALVGPAKRRPGRPRKLPASGDQNGQP